MTGIGIERGEVVEIVSVYVLEKHAYLYLYIYMVFILFMVILV